MGPDNFQDEWEGPWEHSPPWYPTASLPQGRDDPDLELLAGMGELLDAIGGRRGEVLRRRLGLGAAGRETLQEIGDSYGVTRERIRQFQESGLRRLGHGRRLESAERRVVDRLTGCFRSLRQADRGDYLRSTFPDANDRVLVAVLGRLSRAPEAHIASWLAESDEIRAREMEAAAHRDLAGERWDRFLRGAVWPSRRSPAAWRELRPCRAVRLEGGEVESAKLRRKVMFESGLERRLIRLFDESAQVVRYCEQPLRIRFPWFDGDRCYVPDFAVQLDDGRALLVEGKPPTLWVDAMNLAKWNAATRWCAQRGWGFVVSDGRRHPGELLGAADERDLEVLETLTENGSVPWARLWPAWFGSGRSWRLLLSTALSHGFTIRREPRLSVMRARNSAWLDALGHEGLAASPPGR